MTRNDVIKTAFKVWGRDFYRTTSLTDIARELGVSKPALYRHFKDKKALSEAMFTAYFDDFSSFIREGYEHAVSEKDNRKSGLIMMRTAAEYYIRNKDAFIFSLFRLTNSRYRENMNELRNRGVDFERLADRKKGDSSHPSKILLIMITLVFCIAQYHRMMEKSGEMTTDDQIKHTISQAEIWITGGLGLDAAKVAALNFQELEKRTRDSVEEHTGHNSLLVAVAETVAEAGPWDVSMEMVAKRSGLSKSGLYAHFKNKNDMLMQLFNTEFTRIINLTRAQIEATVVSEEQLYLAIISIVNYLRLRPEILIALEWIKSGRMEFGKEFSAKLYAEIHDLKLEAIQNFDRKLLVWITQWILFMIVNTLTLRPHEFSKDKYKNDKSCTGPQFNQDLIKKIKNTPNESFRILFRFIALGLGGLHND
jgi:AcrR family transcriptional regulator